MARALLQESRLRRTQAERRDQSERELVRAAVEALSEEGVSASTFDTIALRSGYSRGMVGQRFGSKQGLIEAVIAYLHHGQESFASADTLEALPGLDCLLAYVDFYLRWLSHMGEFKAYFRLLCWSVADIAGVQSLFAAEHDRVREHFVEWVKRGQSEGQIRNDLDATAVARLVGGQLLGLSIQVLIEPDIDLEPIRSTYLATLRQTLAPGATRAGDASA
jgi:AcrR family transcriptional regulator